MVSPEPEPMTAHRDPQGSGDSRSARA